MRRSGFTMIELMVVVLIVAILAAILVPFLTAKLETARWTEARAGCGTLATAIRATWAEQAEEEFAMSTSPETYLTVGDLRGKYFSAGDYTITFGPTSTQYPVAYTISVGKPKAPTQTVTWTKAGYSLDYTGKWTEL